uniref:Uncharacterized protein n=1 Tax=Octopus bimaculoides TaxID=37653 RepID=A0A0L8HPK8_OCTBM
MKENTRNRGKERATETRKERGDITPSESLSVYNRVMTCCVRNTPGSLSDVCSCLVSSLVVTLFFSFFNLSCSLLPPLRKESPLSSSSSSPPPLSI